MTDWRRFEKHCEKLVRETLSAERWVISPQRHRAYSDGNMRLDIHVHDKTTRGGGFRAVFECKHKPGTGLTKKDVEQVDDQKTRGRVSMAMLLHSSSTDVPESVRRYARDLDIHIVSVEWGKGKLRQIIRDVANRKRLSWSTQVHTFDD